MAANLAFWYEGQPFGSDESDGAFVYWFEGQPLVEMGAAGVIPPAVVIAANIVNMPLVV